MLLVVKSVIDYFTKNGSTVNVATLDVLKAFDKVNIHCLLVKMIKRNVPTMIIDVLYFWFHSSYAYVRWNGCCSKLFKINSGVRQGGVLSPILFTVYIDVVIENLKTCGLGCSINNVYLGCVLYADDVILLSASLHVLQKND